MKISRLFAAACACVMAFAMTACSTAPGIIQPYIEKAAGSGNSVLLEPYSEASADSTDDTVSLLGVSAFQAFAEDLGVISVADNNAGYNKDAQSGVSANSIFLAGTENGEVITASNIFAQIAPASTTKILTALVAVKYSSDDLDKEFTLTNAVTVEDWDSSNAGFEPGDVVTLRTLIYSMLVVSGNDAANAVAIAVAGDISSFADLMNETAKSLGATHSHFTEPHGLDRENHFTTAYDLYLIFRECLKYDLFVDAVGRSSYTAHFTRDGEAVTLEFDSTDKYLTGDVEAPEGVVIVGGKTGTTDNAGHCLILYVKDSEGTGYVSVIMGAQEVGILYSSMSALLSNLSGQ